MYFLCEPLLYMYNLFRNNEIIPNIIKLGKVVPIFKKGDESLACYYRPIFLLGIFDKILEIVLYNRRFKFFEKHYIPGII